MRSARAALAAAAAVTAAGLLAACGSTPGPSASSTTRATTSSPSGPADTTTSTVFTFGDVGSKGKIGRLQHETPTPVAGLPGTVVQIATSNSDGYARTSTGEVFAWGAGAFGELGNGSTVRSSGDAVRVDFPSGVRITSLPNPMPFDGGLAIDSTGHVWGWGVNSANELCLPGTAPVLRPERLPFSDVTLATGAARHNLFYAHDTLYACGQGQSGQLGNGTFGHASTPTAVVGLPTGGIRALTSSWQGSGALMNDGTYYDWGYNAAGQLGDGTTTNRARPVRVALPATVTQVFQGGSTLNNGQTVALLANAELWVWGNGAYGQLGTGTFTNALSPVHVAFPAGDRFVTVTSGGYASYAIDAAGKLWAWGSNSVGQLGTGGSAATQPSPVAVGLAASQVSSTADNVAVLQR
jgi:alpha-tubulin suppressor-like RCC1 family protein